MKKVSILLVTGIIFCLIPRVSAQSRKVITENFDGNSSTWTSSSASAWKIDNNYYVSPQNSIRGIVPNMIGDSVILISPVYDFTGYSHVLFRFRHICKVSPNDIVRIEYKISSYGWQPLPAETYLGKAKISQLGAYNFSANSYSEWQANDSLIEPAQSWWKDEFFDVGIEVGGEAAVQFRFIIQHGNVVGTQISYGWLIDNIEITAATHAVTPPVGEFIAPLVKDSVYNTGPWEINAKVKTTTTAALKNPWLKYTATKNGNLIADDSILMTMVLGDSLWKASIPQFTEGTEVNYSIRGQDATENYITIASAYTIICLDEGDQIIKTVGAFNSAVPMSGTYEYSWSRQLYLASELSASSKGGTITKLSWDNERGSWSRENQSCYFRAVDDEEIISTAYEEPLAAGATLVWSDSIVATATGWIEITLDNPFVLPPGKNLLIYWHNESGFWSSNPMVSWGHTFPSPTKNRSIFATADGSFPSFATGVPLPSHPNIKLYIANEIFDNAVSLHTIDINDTIAIVSGVQIPIVATIKNKGKLNLTSATIYYSINGNTPKQYNWTGNLPWDFSSQDTLDYYTSQIGKKDTLIVWVKLPNGVNDNITYDDTLTKVIYASTDILTVFVNSPTDTIYNTGPFAINANIRTLSGTAVGTVSLNVITTYGGVSTPSTLSMSYDTADNLWKTTIPHTIIGSNIVYSITLIDMLGNVVIVSDSFYIAAMRNEEYVIIGTGVKSDLLTPLNLYMEYSCSRQLYLASEIAPSSLGGTITKLAWDYAYTTSWTRNYQSCYFRAVDDVEITSTAYEDPLAAGGELVWSGTISATGAGWIEITLDNPFVLPPNKNLLIYWHNESNTWTMAFWNHTTTSQNMTVHRNAMAGGLPTGAAGTLTKDRPNVRFSIQFPYPDTSVALVAIESPLYKEVEGVYTPVRVKIHNKGNDNLTSCVIRWSKNGILQPSVTYTGNLSPDFTDTITVGYYQPQLNADTIIVWVSMPNGSGTVDASFTHDDTLHIISTGCAVSLSGMKTVGTGYDFSSMFSAIYNIRECGLTGDLTLQLKGTFVENIDLSDITPFLNGYHLTITSLDNDPDSAIIQPASDVAIKLGNNRDITIKAITVDITTSETSAIQFTNTCTNIVIRDCKLLADTNSMDVTTGSTSTYLIAKGFSTGDVDSIFIINNLLKGGRIAVTFRGEGTTGQYGTNIVFDSNTVIRQYYVTVNFFYVNFISCNYNTIISYGSSLTTTCDALALSYCSGDVIGNRITVLNSFLNIAGISLINYNLNNSTMSLIANNEIIISHPSGWDINSGIYTGIHTSGARCYILHNSIYVSAGTNITGRGIYLANGDYDITVKNNNIIMPHDFSYPIYVDGTNNNWLSKYDMDYNNMYATVYVGYLRKSIKTMSQWKQIATTDIHSVRVLPNMTDPTVSLEPLQDAGLRCNESPFINQDIQGITRSEYATIGCYEIPLTTNNVKLEAVLGFREGYLQGQTDVIKVVIENTAPTALTSVNLGWSVNDVIQNNNLNFSDTLLYGQFDTLTLGQLTYTSGKITVKVWINSLNGGSLSDDFADDDTLYVSGFICTGSYNGLLTIGATGDFPNIEEAYKALVDCGVNGDITIAFQSGYHTGNLDLTKSDSLLNNYSLTLTSVTGNAADATLASFGGEIILCYYTNNLTLRHITLDATQGTYGILLTGYVSNLTVENCNILANPTVTDAGYAGVYSPDYTNELNGITIKNCTIDGGYYGIYLSGGSLYRAPNIVIDSNILTNQSNCAISLHNIVNSSISYNRITCRSINQGINWTGMSFNSSLYSTVIGNRIMANNPAITNYLYGINTSSYLDVVNNDIYLYSDASTMYGIYTNRSSLNIIHNTVYTVNIKTTGINRAFYHSIDAGYITVVRNNIFVASGSVGTTTYAAYFDITTSTFNRYKANYDIDNNEYYSTGTNIGYLGGNRATLAAWKAITSPLDLHSVNLLPDFNNPDVDLTLTNYPDSLLCPRWQNVLADIRNIYRLEPTAMGAYSHFVSGRDLMLKEFSAWNDKVTSNQTAPVNVVLFNTGNVPITTATFEWSVNNVPQPSFSWTATPALNSLEERAINIGTFPVTNIQNYDIVVWIKNINGQADTINWNDTIRASTSLYRLAEFVAPFVSDTIVTLSFPVNVFINQGTGATINPPKMTFISTVHQTTTIYDTILMQQNGNIWQAVIPPKYYGTKIIYSLTISDTVGNSVILTNSTYIRKALSILEDSNLIAPLSLSEPLNTTGCQPDYTPVKVSFMNKGIIDYDFSKDTVLLEVEVIDPDTVKHAAVVPFTGILQPGINVIELLPALPTIHPGAYRIKAWIGSSTDNTPYKDTVNYTYVSGKVGLPIDEFFNDTIPLEFNVWGNNTSAAWTVIPQGTGIDASVQPVFGTGMLSFKGTMGAMSTFGTRQMDLSRTIQPSLSFWYFHDTIPCEDYTDVRVTIDGGTTYTTLFSLAKYDAVYGWRQYSMDLPPYAVNECVILVFEAMEKSRSEDVTQYIDRIRITAKRDIELAEILTSEFSACDMENKEWKVVLRNNTDPVLDYSVTPIDVTLEIVGTSNTFTKTLNTNTLTGLTSDTVTLTPTFNFSKGTYPVKAWFTSVLDDTPLNDTLETSIVINPDLSVQLIKISAPNACLAEKSQVWQEIILTNTGNMDLSNIELVLQIDTGDIVIATYTILTEMYTGTIPVMENDTYRFTTPYTVPWNASYSVRITANLECNITLSDNIDQITECVDTKDLEIVSIDNPLSSAAADNAGSSVQVIATVGNRSDLYPFNNGVSITVWVRNSQGVQTDRFTETTGAIGTLSTTSHTFTQSYTVPEDTVYYLTVYIESNDIYPDNDTIRIKRTTDYTGINTIGSNVFALSQNIPNPATNSTRIDYSVPEAGEVMFHIHSISGQLLYSQTIESPRGTNSIELNTSTFAAGVYFYSMEYKGQRLVRQLIIK